MTSLPSETTTYPDAKLTALKVRLIIGFIATVPLLAGFTLFGDQPVGYRELFRDLVIDFGVVIAGLLIVGLVWTLVGGEPVERAIRGLQERLASTEAELVDFSDLMRKAKSAGLAGVGGDLESLGFLAADVLQRVKQSSKTIDVSGVSLLFLRENTQLINALRDAAERGVKVRVLVSAPDNPYLLGSNDADVIESMISVSQSTINKLERFWGGKVPRPELRSLRDKNMTVSVLRFDDWIKVTPYLASLKTRETPCFTAEGEASPLFEAWSREFDYLFNKGIQALAVPLAKETP